MGQTLIVGAGIAGLTIGYELAKKGQRVIVAEKESRPGGLAKSFRYNGFTFDIGPHRFYANNERTLEFIKHILGSEAESFSRYSGVYVLGKYHSWPLRPATLFKLPPKVMVRSGIDLLFQKLKRADDRDNFEDYICNRYGFTIYEYFFKKYTEKFVGLSPEEMHSDWARVSIDKAVIDKRIGLRSLADVIKSLIMPPKISTEFLYPKDGIGFFCDKLSDKIRQMDGAILENTSVDRINYSEDKINTVQCNGISFTPDEVVWTAPIGIICKLMDLPSPRIDYLSLVLYNIELEGPSENKYQWCYYGDDRIVFNRVSYPSLFSKKLAPEGRSSLCVEVTCREHDDKWNNAESLIDRVVADLKKVKIIGQNSDIASVHVERIPNAYPIYRMGYHNEVSRVKESLTKFKNLTLAGRTGLFWYNNMDDSIENGLVVAEDILR